MDLFWHRRDLRVADNLGLATAAERGPIASVFVFDTDVLAHASDVRVRRLLDGLEALRDAYRDRGSDLLLAHGDPASILPALAEGLDADRVVWNRDYSGLARERDARVRRALAEAGVERDAHHDAVLHTPDSIRTNAGDPYSVYSYYWKKWRDREVDDPVPAPDDADLLDDNRLSDDLREAGLLGPNDDRDGDGNDEGDDDRDGDGNDEGDDVRVAVGELPPMEVLGFGEPDVELQPAGTHAARERLDAFLSEAVFSYVDDRDYPIREGTSRLSAAFKYGEIGPREVYAETERAREAATDRPEPKAEASVEEFQAQLAWREFYTQVLFHNPEVVTENYKTYEEPIDWRDDPEEIEAWKRGETGYPIVDAGMRQLLAEGYMHNRVRMIVASFLTKDLLADWRHGYAHFRDRLADHDTANDNGGWQWAASTGTDAQPYFRIFNPMTQGERYDPDAEYITTYVPELRGVEPDLIHEWPDLLAVQRANAAPEYPDPIVDHAERRERALAMYKRARGEDPDA
ncbi:cryptochrome/photolyase family protein [Halorubrum vacuolatum]|uniref:Deoxyribodipyrimidine photo-lyase n=1 Tax=Halorubrum vacuolatum TaxID=63740 RepID=A0A238X1Z1_HALVU|nr:deoxyribodipyrimidine photo-lyase [Halorubrum vacuolatum]SNR52641.1 deoxyribodipyrimidine photo-lyase [Halorubrum vacuolatum]